MDGENLLGYFIIGLIVIICLKLYYDSDAFHLTCIVSDVNGNKYCVRERKNMDRARDLLAQVTENLKKVVAHLHENYRSKENVQRLVKKFNPKKN